MKSAELFLHFKVSQYFSTWDSFKSDFSKTISNPNKRYVLFQIDNKMLSELSKCEDSAIVDPPKSEILYASNFIATNVSNIDNKEESKSIPIEDLIQRANSDPTTSISCAPSLSGLPKFSISVDKQLTNDHLSIVKKKLMIHTIHRRLTYLADFYYRELLGTISWAKALPGIFKFLKYS